MIVYAFYGLGKSTFVARHKSMCRDIDEQDYMLSIDFPQNYVEHIYGNHESKKIVFTNVRSGIIDDNDVALAFIPMNMEMVAERLRWRGTSETFIKELLDRDNEIFDELLKRFPNAIIVPDDKYLADYEDLIMERSKEIGS